MPCVESILYEKFATLSDAIWSQPELQVAKIGNGQRQLGLLLLVIFALVAPTVMGWFNPKKGNETNSSSSTKKALKT